MDSVVNFWTGLIILSGLVVRSAITTIITTEEIRGDNKAEVEAKFRTS